jgi:hypothetical protein
MADEVKRAAEPGLVSLVGGIVGNAQTLIEQQATLLRREIEGEIRHAQSAALSLAVGTGITTVGSVLLLLMVVHAVQAATAMPLWGCYGLVGGVVVVVGALLLFFGGREAAAVQLIPPPQTTEALKENVEWLKQQTTSKPS